MQVNLYSEEIWQSPNINQVIIFTIKNTGTSKHYLHPDMVLYEAHDITHETFLPKIFHRTVKLTQDMGISQGHWSNLFK